MLLSLSIICVLLRVAASLTLDVCEDQTTRGCFGENMGPGGFCSCSLQIPNDFKERNCAWGSISSSVTTQDFWPFCGPNSYVHFSGSFSGPFTSTWRYPESGSSNINDGVFQLHVNFGSGPVKAGDTFEIKFYNDNTTCGMTLSYATSFYVKCDDVIGDALEEKNRNGASAEIVEKESSKLPRRY